MRSISLAVVLSMMLISSCVSAQNDYSVIQQQKEFVVALEKSDQNAAYAHPADLEVSALKAMLKSLDYARKEGVLNLEETGPVFQESEIELLAQPLVSALSRVSQNQHVRFASFNTKKSLMVITTYQHTEGILFRDSDSRINIAFSQINSKLASEDAMSLKAELSGKDPMKTADDDIKLSFRTPYFQHHVSPAGRVFPLWVTAADTKVSIPQKIVPKQDASTQMAPVPKQPVNTVPAIPRKLTIQQEVKEKLVYLKGLLDEGLITEADYNEKKKRLLDQLD